METPPNARNDDAAVQSAHPDSPHQADQQPREPTTGVTKRAEVSSRPALTGVIGPDPELSAEWGFTPEEIASEKALFDQRARQIELRGHEVARDRNASDQIELARVRRGQLEALAKQAEEKRRATESGIELTQEIYKGVSIVLVVFGLVIAVIKNADPATIKWIIEKLIEAFS